jgi:hypothetical protein
LLAGQDLLPTEVATIGDDIEIFDSGGKPSLLSHSGQRSAVVADVGDLTRDDQVALCTL